MGLLKVLFGPTARRASRALRLITRESARDSKGSDPLAPPYALPFGLGFARECAALPGIAPGLIAVPAVAQVHYTRATRVQHTFIEPRNAMHARSSCQSSKKHEHEHVQICVCT